MLNEESTHVILLEYIEGSTLAQLKDKYSSHSSLEHNCLPEESYTKWLEIAKELISCQAGTRHIREIGEK